jgi:hypothetical protein
MEGDPPHLKEVLMSIEDALVAGARSGMFAAKARAVMERERTNPDFSPKGLAEGRPLWYKLSTVKYLTNTKKDGP